MDDLRQQNRINNINKNYAKKSFLFRNKWKILLIILIILILIFPKEIGQIIGQFINDFFGTIIEYSIK